MTTKAKIENALWKQRNLAHQMGLEAERLLVDLGLMTNEQRLFLSKKERSLLYNDDEVIPPPA